MINHAYVSAISANIIAFTMGTAFTWSSPVLSKLNSTNPDVNPLGYRISSEESTWIGSMQSLGAILGPIMFGFLVDKIGRKLALLLVAIPFITSFLVLAFARIIALFYVARFIMGIAVGGTFAIIPMYVGEVAQSTNRGILSTMMHCLMSGGILFCYAVGPYCTIMIFNIILLVIPVIFLVLFFFLGSESPYYYVARDNYDAASKSLERLRGLINKNIESELSEIKKNIENNKKGKIKDIFKSKGLIKAFIICFGLISFQQFAGVTAVLTYTQTIFESTGSSISPEICSIVVGVVQFVASFLTPLLVDRLGRKILLYFSTIGMCLSQVILGTYFYLHDNGTNLDAISWLPLVVLIVFLIACNCGLNPLPWTIIGEVFPSNVKSAAASLIAAYGSLLGFLITKFLLLFGMAVAFWIFSGFCMLAFLFVLFYVIETKGKSLQEIQNELESS